MKKIMLRTLVFCLLFLLLIPSLTACTGKNAALVGRWETVIDDEELGQVTMVYRFTGDKEIFLEQRQGDTIPFSIPFGTWRVKGEKLLIESDGVEDTFTFSVSSDVLTLSGPEGEDLVFSRVS